MNIITQASDLSLNLLLAKTGLLFCNPTVMIAVFLLGFFFHDSKTFPKAFTLLLFTMVYNFYLKSIWKIPLTPPLEGWAFPSGHMHAAWVFWGYLAWHFKKFFWFLGIMLLAMYGMIYHDFHNINDLVGAIGFGSLSIFLFLMLNKIPSIKDNLFFITVIISNLSLIFLFMIPMPEQTKPHLWMAQGGLMGMSIGWYYLASYKTPPLKIPQRFVLAFLSLLGAAIIHYTILQPFSGVSLRNFFFIKSFVLTLWIISSQRLLMMRCIINND